MKSGEEQLLDLFERLAPEQQDRLIAFAEFLADDPVPAPGIERELTVIPRPDGETVTMAIRRLVRSCPTLDRRQLMVEASRFMAQHALGGRAAAEVIDELERVFTSHYEQYKSRVESRKAEGGSDRRRHQTEQLLLSPSEPCARCSPRSIPPR